MEQPGIGDYARRSFAGDGENPIFAHTNRGKKSVTIDLKDAAAERTQFLKLLAEADIVIEGFRPDVMDRLGLGYEALHAHNPRLIYVALTGYGRGREIRGACRARYQLSGIVRRARFNWSSRWAAMSLGHPGCGPRRRVDAGGDRDSAGDRGAASARAKASESTFRCLQDPLRCCRCRFRHFSRRTERPERGKERLSGRYACYQIYAAGEGTYVAVGALEPKFWRNLCRELGCEELIEDQYADDARQAEIENSACRRNF